MFAKKGGLISAVNRKVRFDAGVKDLDYTVDGHKRGILLHTADKEHLTKGKRQVIILTTKVVPSDRILAVKIHNDLLRDAAVSGTAWIDPDDTGEIVLTVVPRKDIDLGQLEYICKILIEGLT